MNALPLGEALERGLSIRRRREPAAPAPIAVLSPSMSGGQSLHVVSSLMHVQILVAYRQSSHLCCHEEYLLAAWNASGSSPETCGGKASHGEMMGWLGNIESENVARFSIPFATFEAALRLLAVCAARGNSWNPLAGILVRVKEGNVTFMASEGSRLWLSSYGVETEGEGEFILSPAVFMPFKRLRGVLHAKLSARQVCLALGPVTVHSLLSSGPYPFSGRIPSLDPEDTMIEVEGRAVVQAVQALRASGMTGQAIRIRCMNHSLALSLWSDAAQGEERVPAHVRGEAHLALGRQALLDFAKLLPTLRLRVKCFPAPVTIQSDCGTGLLMPVAFGR